MDALTLLSFLYASMPLPDSVDYPREYWLQNIETTLEARQEMAWGQQIPEREFRHFVLPVRVNNENLDDSRQVFYEELKERVRGLSMSDAILEVNHWCHEKVTYQPSDERTSSPLATVKSAIGRCGEESTFLVSALRSVCIPARQVYTPRWAHTDDNHAWVEAWADGEWHFLGACEPEPVLDLGWFNAPASRGMLMHTKAFGQYAGPEEVIQRNACFTEIDVTSNYAPVAVAYARVVDQQGRAVPDAKVEFKIYNYAEFYTVSTKQTDADGLTYMQAGRGDLVAWAYKDGAYGFTRFPVVDGDTVEVVLDHRAGETYSLDMEIVPPKERNTVPPMTEVQKSENVRRLAYEDSLRNAYVASFPQLESIDLFAQTHGLPKEELRRLVTASRGNHDAILRFLSQYSSSMPMAALSLLNSLSEKDLRDIPYEVLESHLVFSALPALQFEGRWSDSIFHRYVACPRVANEKLTTYRRIFYEGLGEARTLQMMMAGPEPLVRWVADSIRIDTEHNPQQLRMTPIGVWNHRVTDEVSRNIFFVAFARTLGFPSRIDPVTGKVQYLEDGGLWHDVVFDAESDVSKAKDRSEGQLAMSYKPVGYLTDPKYYPHFTLSRIDDGRPTLLNYGEEDTWSSLFGEGKCLQLDAGDYLLTSGTRMADGSVLVHLEVAPVQAGKLTTMELQMRQAQQGLQVIGSLNAEHLYKPVAGGAEGSILATTGRGFYVLGLIAPNNEPSNHALRDIAQYRQALDAWGGTLLLLFRNQEEASRFRREEFPELPAKTVFGIDHTGAIIREIQESLHLTSATMPLVVIADTFNRIVFCSEGYTIGMGEQLVKGLESIK